MPAKGFGSGRGFRDSARWLLVVEGGGLFVVL